MHGTQAAKMLNASRVFGQRLCPEDKTPSLVIYMFILMFKQRTGKVSPLKNKQAFSRAHAFVCESPKMLGTKLDRPLEVCEGATCTFNLKFPSNEI